MASSSTSQELAGLKAAVTGASSGIGRAIARVFAEAGADLLIHCNQSIDRARELEAEIGRRGSSARVMIADISSGTACKTFARSAWDEFGPVDIWVNNAGADVLTGPAAKLPFEKKLDLLRKVDLEGTIFLSREIGSLMKARGSGTILNIGWDQAERGMEGDSGELFAAIKGGIMAFTRSLSLSLAPHVRVNCLAPGWIQTSWGENAPEYWQERAMRESPLNRWGLPDDVAAAARFLASPSAAFITGQVVRVNGGAVR